MRISPRSIRTLGLGLGLFGVLCSSIAMQAGMASASTLAFNVHDLGPISGYSIGTGISSNGIVTGAWGTQLDIYGNISDAHAFRLRNNAIVTLSTLHGGATSYAYDANSKGRVVGQSDLSGGATHAVYWVGTKVHDLGAFPGNLYSAANAINDSGKIAGYSDVNSDAGLNAVVWGNNHMTNLGSLVANGNSEAYDINKYGAV